MKTSAHRLEAFSDGVMAIIITIMALNIPLPDTFDFLALLSFLEAIGIFFISFIIVGAQWNKHRLLFSACEDMTQDIVMMNILFLFFLTLIPLFTKWVMQNPGEVIPVLSYDIIFFLVNVCYQNMFHKLLHANYDEEFLKQRREQMQRLKENEPTWRRLGLMIITLLLIIVLSLFLPQISVYFFMALPIVFSFLNLSKKHGVRKDHFLEKRPRIFHDRTKK